MDKIADPNELEGLAPPLRRFIDAAWAPPSTEPSTVGVRQLQLAFPDQREIMTAAAAVMKDAFFERGQSDEVVYNPNPNVNAFEQWTWHEGTLLRVCRLLMEAWNERRDLGTCQNCGSLFLPGRGRIAKYCDDVCRMQAKRSQADQLLNDEAEEVVSIRSGRRRSSSKGRS